jgi:hypothetical protein
VRNLDLAAYTQLSEEDQAKGVQTKFNLMASTQHDGQPDSGTYRTYVHFKANDQWSAVPPPPHAPCDAPLAVALSCLSFAEEPLLACIPSQPEPPPPGRYDIQDLHVNGVHPQLISVSESYIQVYDSSPS